MTCDYKGCDDFAQWYREVDGQILTFCSKHEAECHRRRIGKKIDESKLDEQDILELEEKEREREHRLKKPFYVKQLSIENGIAKIRIYDRQTNERRLFSLKEEQLETFNQNYISLDKKGFSPKPSIEEYIKSLRNGL